MSKKLYVGGLPYEVNDEKLQSLAAPFGEVVSAKVIMDKFTGQSKGFGFVEFANNEDADKAITALDGSELGGRSLKVNEARPMEPRSGGGRPGGGGGFRDRNGGGGGGRGGRGNRDREGGGGGRSRW